MIFPGMDPYLEDPYLWPGLHTRLIVHLCDHLQPLINPGYVATIEERVFVDKTEEIRIPDVIVKRRREREGGVAVIDADDPVVVKAQPIEIHQRYVAIRARALGQTVVTVIEMISPNNKRAGGGRRSYVTKQKQVLRSKTHLVEIDLLRTGQHVVAVAESTARSYGPYDYLACVSRAIGTRDEFDLYPRTLRQRLPRIRIPLAKNDPDVGLDVQQVVSQAYKSGAYGIQIDYRKPCNPSLSADDAAWAAELIKRSLGGNGRNGRRRPKL
jgi:Protein of unknown function (DUF4058)